MILLFVAITLLLLRNNLISFYQSLNFTLFLLNHIRSRTMLFSNSICSFCIFAGAVDISFVYSVVFSKMFSVIFNDPSCSDNASILYSQCLFVLLSIVYATSILYLPMVKPSIVPVVWPLYTLFLQGEPSDTLPNVMILNLA